LAKWWPKFAFKSTGSVSITEAETDFRTFVNTLERAAPIRRKSSHRPAKNGSNGAQRSPIYMQVFDGREGAMAATNPPRTAIDQPLNGTVELCDECETETPHEVAIEIRSESADPANAGCSREPYRVTTCSHCGTGTVLRMNNA
jgi:hypothetical protein